MAVGAAGHSRPIKFELELFIVDALQDKDDEGVPSQDGGSGCAPQTFSQAIVTSLLLLGSVHCL